MSLHALARYVGNCVSQFIWNWPWPCIIPRFINLHYNAQACIARLYPCPHHCFKNHSVFQISQILQSKPSKRIFVLKTIKDFGYVLFFWRQYIIQSYILHKPNNSPKIPSPLLYRSPLSVLFCLLTCKTLDPRNHRRPKCGVSKAWKPPAPEPWITGPPANSGRATRENRSALSPIKTVHRLQLHSSWRGDVDTNYCGDRQKNMKRVSFCRETGCDFTAEFRSSHRCRTWTKVRQRQNCPLGSAKVDANYFRSWSQLA